MGSNRATTPRPRWPEPYSEPLYIAGYQILKYQGFRRKHEDAKGHHYYTVECTLCGGHYTRSQATIQSAVNRRNNGCIHCARKAAKIGREESRQLEEARIKSEKKAWLWAMFIMPTTSLSMRALENRLFDTEYAKILKII